MALDDLLETLFRAELGNASRVLDGGRDRDTAVKLTMGAGARADRTFLPVLRDVACGPGCSFCCHGVRVDVTAPEALTLARGFRETLSPADLKTLRSRVNEHAARVRGSSVRERYRAGLPCVLLDVASGRCAVHEARPMRCRAHHSLDANECEAAVRHPDEARTVTRHPEVLDAHEAMIRGQKEALAGAGLDARAFDLSLALAVALEEEDAAERWANGEPVFDGAVFHPPP
ncbi:MAG TPA: YkgJ family cysteine cluster protein [Polyangiaceae bacterium]|nr:YkgJ family cysteine cluster protein [Polyangiaceae bacterium]